MAEDALHNIVRRFYRDGIPCRRFLNDDRGFLCLEVRTWTTDTVYVETMDRIIPLVA